MQSTEAMAISARMGKTWPGMEKNEGGPFKFVRLYPRVMRVQPKAIAMHLLSGIGMVGVDEMVASG